MADIIQVVTTLDNKEAAQALGRRLVDERLVACCQIIGPIRSIYRWKGAVEQTDEWCCVLKTRPSLYRKVEKAIIDLHPYEVPEIVATTVSRAFDAYARWVGDETS